MAALAAPFIWLGTTAATVAGTTAGAAAIGAGAGAATSLLTKPKIPDAKPPSVPAPARDRLAERKRADAAATRQRRKAGGAGGRRSTILTGPSGLGELGSGQRQQKTILGY